MTTDPITGIRVLGETVPYLDGSEDELLPVVEGPGDRSTGSDDLAAHIKDWPSRYHLSRLRANLLRPVRLGPGMRVLDVGAGTGPLARYAAETGAEVVALEGSLARARVAAARCSGLSNVEVVCGRPEDLGDEQFDLVLAVGVLEYASASIGGSTGAEAFLETLTGLAGADGAVAVAIENQLGLKYLLGYAEDHLAEPWIGVENYPGPPGPRTFSRHALAARLSGVGLSTQHWLFPFPDYKLPSVVLDERVYDRPDCEVLIDQLVGSPVRDDSESRVRLCDDRQAHRVFLAAGLGPDVANSFLVVAARTREVIDRFITPDAVAFHFGGERMRLWLRTKTILDDGHGRLRVEAAPIDRSDAPHERGWLAQAPDEVTEFASGPTLEQLFFDACARHDLDGATAVLTRWRDELARHEIDRGAGEPGSHPFLPAGTRRVLLPPYVDVELSNFVAAGDSLVCVDTEWRIPDGVSVDLACLRALWFLSERLVVSGAEHPWPHAITVDELAETLARRCGVTVNADALDQWRAAEAELQAKVTGQEAAPIANHLAHVGGSSRLTAEVSRSLPFTRLRRDSARLHARNRELEEEQAGRMHYADELELLRRRSNELEVVDGELRRVQTEYAAREQELEAARKEVAEVHGFLQAAQGELNSWIQRWDRVERLLPVRILRALRRLTRI